MGISRLSRLTYPYSVKSSACGAKCAWLAKVSTERFPIGGYSAERSGFRRFRICSVPYGVMRKACNNNVSVKEVVKAEAEIVVKYTASVIFRRQEVG